MNNNLQTGFLFAQPSFASGMARILDLWGQFDEYNESGSESGCRVLSGRGDSEKALRTAANPCRANSVRLRSRR